MRHSQRAWQKLRAMLLAAEPLCRPCRAQGRTTAAAEVDHITPVAEGGTDEVENLQPICRDCHFVKTAGENRRRHKPSLAGACGHGVPAGTACPECVATPQGADTMTAAGIVPFVKWAGGKRALIPALAKHFPERIGTYWEPFVGGGAAFFTFADRMDRAILSDRNEELVIAYQIVKDRVDELIEALRAHERGHKDDHYYLRVRAQEPTDALAIAARFIYLNKTCFNGLYRVNKVGKFNVPKGRYKNPDICNPDKLRAASKVLAKATVRLGDFNKVVQPGAEDFIYCDPPYDECFTSYQPGGFTGDDQERLRNAVDTWADAGAAVLLSNSDTALIRRLYRGGFSVHETEAPRLINSRAEGRGAVAELIITMARGARAYAGMAHGESAE